MNFKKYHVSKNLFDAATAYGNLYNNGVISGTTLAISRIRNFFNESQVGKQITLTIKADKVTATRIYINASIAGTVYNSNSIYADNTGVMQIMVTPQSASDYWFVTYGSNANNECILSNIMLNTGSSPLPYEPYGNSWHSIPHYIHNTSTDTITTLPANIYPNAVTATVGLKGNTVQSTTPTPDNPVMPQGCGDMTKNLFNPYTAVNGYYISDTNGELKPASNNVSSDYIEVEGDTDYYITMIPSGNWGAWYDEDKTYISGIIGYNIRKSPANAKFVRLTVSRNNNPDYATNFMITKSSVSIPYEPYGYKIPILSASTTTPVYLGEVETTRRIRELVLTGDENWNVGSANYYTRLPSDGRPYSTALCTHAKNASTIDNNGAYLYLQKSTFVFETLTDFKTYLAQQYTNGTPVTIWYVLATPETAVVNEPLRKIGDYADTLSNVTIPVTAGGDTFSVDTTLQPSEATVNYKGWHPVQSVHERENGAWD